MNGWTSSSAEHSRLLAQSQRLRVQAIQVRLMSGQAFCSIVETEARWGSHQKAQLKMAKVWRLIVELARHIDEPNHIPSEAVPNLRKDLMALQERAQSIHRKLLASELPPRRQSAR